MVIVDIQNKRIHPLLTPWSHQWTPNWFVNNGDRVFTKDINSKQFCRPLHINQAQRLLVWRRLFICKRFFFYLENDEILSVTGKEVQSRRYW